MRKVIVFLAALAFMILFTIGISHGSETVELSMVDETLIVREIEEREYPMPKGFDIKEGVAFKAINEGKSFFESVYKRENSFEIGFPVKRKVIKKVFCLFYKNGSGSVLEIGDKCAKEDDWIFTISLMIFLLFLILFIRDRHIYRGSNKEVLQIITSLFGMTSIVGLFFYFSNPRLGVYFAVFWSIVMFFIMPIGIVTAMVFFVLGIFSGMLSQSNLLGDILGVSWISSDLNILIAFVLIISDALCLESSEESEKSSKAAESV